MHKMFIFHKMLRILHWPPLFSVVVINTIIKINMRREGDI